jgi:hypothetical protein
MLPPVKDIRLLAEALQWVLRAGSDQANQECPVVVRRRKFDARLLAQTLVLGFWREPKATTAQLAQTACELGCRVSPQAIDQRCGQAASAFLKCLLLHSVQKRITSAGSTSWLNRFSAVELLDSTTLTLPAPLRHLWQGCSSTAGPTAALKVQVCLDFLHGGMRWELRPGVENDQRTSLKTDNLQPNALHVRDLGYFDLDVLKTIADKQAYFVSRLQDGTALYNDDGKRLDLAKLLRTCKKGAVDMPILAGKTMRVPMRLITLRLPKAIAKQRRVNLRAKGRKKGYQPKPETLELRGWSIYVTNASSAQLSVAQVQALLRLRWQIELLFKLWKSYSGLEDTRSKDPWRVLCETYAKLLAALLQHWLMVTAHWQKLNRSWFKAAQVIRNWVTVLTLALKVTSQLTACLERVCEIVKQVAHTNSRRKHPAAFQVIEDPESNGYQNVTS